MPLTDMFTFHNFPLAPMTGPPSMLDTLQGQGVLGLANPSGIYDPAVGSQLASGEFGPVVAELAKQGVGPEAAEAALKAQKMAGGIGQSLLGVTAPAAPQSNMPRVDAPPPPRPTGGADPSSVIALLERLRGGPPLPLRLGGGR